MKHFPIPATTVPLAGDPHDRRHAAVGAEHVPAARNPHYERLGGESAVRRLVERFYALMDEQPNAAVVRAMHPADLTGSKERFFMFLSGWLGGPALYAQRFGPPKLRRAHLRFDVDAEARDAWMRCMTQALDELVGDPALRAEIGAAFGKVAESVRTR